jgi:hypothetical protein
MNGKYDSWRCCAETHGWQDRRIMIMTGIAKEEKRNYMPWRSLTLHQSSTKKCECTAFQPNTRTRGRGKVVKKGFLSFFFQEKWLLEYGWSWRRCLVPVHRERLVLARVLLGMNVLTRLWFLFILSILYLGAHGGGLEKLSEFYSWARRLWLGSIYIKGGGVDSSRAFPQCTAGVFLGQTSPRVSCSRQRGRKQ